MKETMTRATGVGGVFLRAADPEKLHAWYEEHLGIKRTEDGAFAFFSEGPREMTVFAFFPTGHQVLRSHRSTGHAQSTGGRSGRGPGKTPAAAVDIDPKREDHDYGRFAWFNDPEGNRVELWQPPGLADA